MSRLLRYIEEEGEVTANAGPATVTSDIAKYEPKLSFMTRRKKKRVRKPKVDIDETG
jgi:hypothetical protein